MTTRAKVVRSSSFSGMRDAHAVTRRGQDEMEQKAEETRVDGPTAIPGQRATAAESEAEPTCEHGAALDVHCCNCHSGFIFDRHHECPDEEGEDYGDGEDGDESERCSECGAWPEEYHEMDCSIGDDEAAEDAADCDSVYHPGCQKCEAKQ